MSAWRLKRKKKPNIGLTVDNVRRVVKEELEVANNERKTKDSEEKEKVLRIKKLNALSPQKRLKLLRYLNRKGEKHGKD